MIHRREFIPLLGGAAAWPLAAVTQQPNRKRLIGVMLGGAEDDPIEQMRISTLRQALQQLGWRGDRNVEFFYRWPAGNRELIRKYADEVVAAAPDVILAQGSGIVGPLQMATHALPIVFVGVVDPVAGGFVASLPRPGGNATGFTDFEYGLAGKWPELLKQITPPVSRVAALRDPAQFAGGGQLGAIQAVAPFFRLEVIPVDVRNASEIERAITAFARESNGGLIVLSSFLARINRHAIIGLADRYRLPAIYPDRVFASDGGLASYGPDGIDAYRLAASYIDRILKGEKPADLPVQAPTKYELVINLKTAKAQGIAILPNLFARADLVIE